MFNQKKFIVSHAPFWHDGSGLSQKHYHIILAALPAAIAGIYTYGGRAVAVLAFAVGTAILWELLINLVGKQKVAIGDGNAALIGLLFGMLLPATTPWWALLVGTFVAVVIGKQIFGGLGGNPFNPVLLSVAILSVSWTGLFDFDEALLGYDFEFTMAYPLAALKHVGPEGVAAFTVSDLLLGRQTGGVGSTCGILLILGGLYLIIRGFIRWEISLSFLAGIFITALLFKFFGSPGQYEGPLFHLLTGYTLIGAFFLATEDSSSPVNFIPMLIYGAGCGIMTILIRNLGDYVDGVVFAILLMNLVNPIIDKIRPKALGKVV